MPGPIIAYFATVIPFLVLDAIWLKFFASPMFNKYAGHLLADEPKLGAAVAFYLIYIVGVVYFAVLPALNSGNWTIALLNGALLGLIAYGTYDATNYATLKEYPLGFALMDTVWGAVVTGASATIGFLLTRLILR